jgi:hypothetical protein
MSYIRQICKDEHRKMEPWERKLDAELDRELLRSKRVGKSFDEVLKEDDEADDDERPDHHASVIADLLVEAGSFATRDAALQYLLHTHDGAALLHRMRTTKQ